MRPGTGNAVEAIRGAMTKLGMQVGDSRPSAAEPSFVNLEMPQEIEKYRFIEREWVAGQARETIWGFSSFG